MIASSLVTLSSVRPLSQVLASSWYLAKFQKGLCCILKGADVPVVSNPIAFVSWRNTGSAFGSRGLHTTVWSWPTELSSVQQALQALKIFIHVLARSLWFVSLHSFSLQSYSVVPFVPPAASRAYLSHQCFYTAGMFPASAPCLKMFFDFPCVSGLLAPFKLLL